MLNRNDHRDHDDNSLRCSDTPHCSTDPDKRQRQLANLQPWKPGQSGNVAGRKAGAVYLSEHLSMMATWTRAEVQAVVDDDATPIMQRIAGRRLLAADSDDRAAGVDFDRLADRTEGRPHQSVRITAHDPRSADQRAAELLARLREKLPQCFAEQIAAVPGGGQD